MSEENDAVRDKKDKAEKMPLLFDDFEAGEKLARELIKEEHPDLATARFRIICRNKASKRGGKPVSGQVKKLAPQERFLVDADYLMTIALECWNPLEPWQRVAFVDHLLTRCYGVENETTGEMKWCIRPPDIQEFPEVAARHGQWHAGLEEFAHSLHLGGRRSR